MRELPQIAPSVYLAASQTVHKGPCIVKSVHVAAAAADGDCSVYDGVSTSGKLKAHIQVVSKTSYTWRPGDGTDFEEGLHIVVNAATTKVTVTFIPESRKAFI